MARKDYGRAKDKFPSIMKALIRCTGMMINHFQIHHVDLQTAFALTSLKWQGWCMQWHMYKRDYELTRTHQLIPAAGYRYEIVCLYLETLLRMEVKEAATQDSHGIKKKCNISVHTADISISIIPI